MMKRMAMMMLIAVLGAAAVAQEKTAAIAPPVTGLLVHYSYWPEQYVQWVGTELPYSMLALEVDATGASPVYDAVLTERATNARVHYTNVQAIADAARLRGDEAYVTKIEFTRPDAPGTGAVYSLKFTLHDGTPLQWQFVEASDVSDRGSGTSPIPDIKAPAFSYRELGSVAAEGTALQIGDRVSAADVWKEISYPPYFIAYHGAVSQGATIVVLGAGDERWTVASAPSALTEGAQWKLTSANERERTLTVEKAEGGQYTIGVSEGMGGPVKQTMDATYGPDGWAVERLHYVPAQGEAHAFSLVFSPALTATGTSNADLVMGKKTKVATATVVTAAGSIDVTMKTPDWLKGKEMAGTVDVKADSVEVKIGPK